MQFNISFDPASPDLGSLTASEQQAILDTANAAAAIWSWYLTPANITLDLEITVDNNLFSGNVLAIGGPDTFLPTGANFGVQPVYDSNTAIELRTGVDQNGSVADLIIGLTVDSIRNKMYFKTDPTAAVPGNRYDALSIFLHEIGHGLGFLYGGGDPSGVSTFDMFVQNGAFTGPNAVAAYSGFSIPLPLDPLSLSHLSATAFTDLMTPAISAGVNRGISLVDLGILQDIGIPIRLPTGGDDVIHDVVGRHGVLVNLYLGAGNDTGYALWSGGSRIFGEDGDDQLFGDKSSDYLDGGSGNDTFRGGGGDDSLFGGGNLDAARYSGLASDYFITRITDWYTQVKDMRPGSPDGTDYLYDVERLQWGDGSFYNLNRPPQLVTQPLSWFKNQGLSLTQLASYSDPDGNAVTKYQLLDTTADPNSGYFMVNGVVQAANTVITVTVAQFAYTTFVTGTVGDDLQIRAFDGYYWTAPDNGPWAPFRLSITAGPPVLTFSNITALANQTMALSSLFSASSDAPITQYRLRDGNFYPSSGYFVVNGVIQNANTPITITAAELAQTYFVSGTRLGDELQISAFNGYYWSNTASIQVNPSGPLNFRPEMTLGTWSSPAHTAFANPLGYFTAQRNQVLSPGDFSHIYDADGDAITKYELFDATTDPNSGHWAINGMAQAAGVALELTPAQWAQTTFVTGIVGDVIRMRVFDGKNWNATTVYDPANGVDYNFIPADTIGGTLKISLVPYVIMGTPGIDSLVGTAGDDEIYGLDGEDIQIEGGLGNDILDGGPGSDWAYYQGPPENYTIKRVRGGGAIISGPEGTDTLYNIEHLHFINGIGNTNITIGLIVDGTPGNDHLQGSEVYGYDGDDDLQGQTGYQEILDGGNGNDMLTGTGTLLGGAGDDRLYPYSPRNSIIDGGPGTDIVEYNFLANGSITVDLVTGVASSIGNDILISVEGADVSGIGDVTMIGNDGDNGLHAQMSGTQIILAGGGNDYVSGRFGTGGMYDGGSGINLLSLDRANRYSGAGYPLVGTPYTDPFIHTFTPGANGALPDGITYANFDYLVLETGNGDDSITFNHPKSPTDFNSYYSGRYNRWLAGDGNDTLTMDLSSRTQSFRMINGIGALGDNYANFQDLSGVGDVLFMSSVENYRIISGLGNDEYTTGSGKDVLNGGPGNDILNGGAGNDVAVFSGNRSAYNISHNPDGSFTVSGPDGTDTLTNIERVAFADQTVYLPGAPALVSDFDGNGKSDILWQDDSGQAMIWLLNGTAVSSSALAGANPGTSWHVKGSGDFDGDGRADILWQNDSGQAALWMMDGLSPVSGALAGGNPGPSWHVKSASDFDGDGRSDILWQNDDGYAAIWFMSGATVRGGALAGGNPGPSWQIKGSGDFDGDGNADILWQNDSGQAALWLMDGANVTGQAWAGTNPGASWHVKGSGDFDGDGKVDILWQDDSGQAMIWLMNGTSVSSQAPVGSNPGTSWKVVSAADIDGDGMSDILWQNDAGQAQAWLMSGTTVSSQALIGSNPGASWHAANNGFTPPPPRKVASDFDRNGKSDILWQDDSGQAMIWLLNGTAVSSSALAGANPGTSWHVKGLGDFDGDGRADILWQNDSGQAALWMMDGLTPVSGALAGGNPGPSWHVKGSGDFDGDGKADILWQSDSGQAALWLMNGATVRGGALAGGDPGPTWHVKGAGDFNGDGKADLLWQNDSGQAAIWLMNGTGVIGQAWAGANPGASWHVKGSGDFDGDSKADILWQSDSGQAMIWLMNGTTVSSQASVGPNLGTSWKAISPADIDGDGMSDILWQNDSGQAQAWLMNGTTVSSQALIGSNPSASWHVANAGFTPIPPMKVVNDFNRDGKSDILWQDDSGQLLMWQMDGSAVTSSALIGGNPGSSWHVKGSSDFDGDGKADILWQNDSGQAALWQMDGANVLSQAWAGGNPGPTWHVKSPSDFNGDGRADILWQNDNGYAAIWLMNGATVTGAALAGANPGPAWQIKGSGDFDGDGKADLLWQNDSGQAALWFMDGATVTDQAWAGSNPGVSWHVKGAGDFDGDGKADILWQNDSGQAMIWLMNGTSVSSQASVGPNLGPSWHTISAADINGDGMSDVLWQNDSGQATAWIMSGTSISSTALLGSNLGPTFHMIAAIR